MFDTSIYASRRAALLGGLAARGRDSGLVLFLGNGESPMNYEDNSYPFRQDSSFLYFFGLELPGLAASLDLGTGKTRIYGRELTMDDIIWTGPQPSLSDMAALSGIDSTGSREAVSKDVTRGRGSGTQVLYLPPYRADTRAELAALTGKKLMEVDSGASMDLILATIELRELKSPPEIAEMEKAVAASVAMHKAAIGAAKPGMREFEIAALATEAALASGGRLAFPIIATTKGAILHNHSYGRTLERGGLFLLDAGAESGSGYAGDLTSTFPIGGRFDPRQLEIYRIAIAATEAASSAIAPGKSYREAHFAAARAITEGLKSLGLMRGDTEGILASGAHALFFPHGIGHMIGLDVHDMENYGEDLVGYGNEGRSSQFGLKSLRLAKSLIAGMTQTVEPGIYFIPELIEKWSAEGRFADFIAYDKLGPWMNIGGVRNEENWLVLEGGGRRLGPEFDKGPEAIEGLRA